MQKVKSFGVHTIKIKDNSTKNIFQSTQKALKRIKKNGQPVFLEISTYREVDHVGINYDFALGYRKKRKQKMMKSLNELKFLKQNTKILNKLKKKLIKKFLML